MIVLMRIRLVIERAIYAIFGRSQRLVAILDERDRKWVMKQNAHRGIEQILESVNRKSQFLSDIHWQPGYSVDEEFQPAVRR